jgi:hypothetical protein
MAHVTTPIHAMHCPCGQCSRPFPRPRAMLSIRWPTVITSSLICWIVVGILLDITGCTPAIGIILGML